MHEPACEMHRFKKCAATQYCIGFTSAHSKREKQNENDCNAVTTLQVFHMLKGLTIGASFCTESGGRAEGCAETAWVRPVLPGGNDCFAVKVMPAEAVSSTR